MIERIASSLPIQERPPGVATPVTEGNGFAEELAVATKADKPKDQADDPKENGKNGCCGNDNNDKNSALNKPLSSGQGAE